MNEKLELLKQKFAELGYTWRGFKTKRICLDSNEKRISIVNANSNKHWTCYSYVNEDEDDFSGSVTAEEHKLINELLIELGWYQDHRKEITEIKALVEEMSRFSDDLDSEFYEVRGKILELCDEMLGEQKDLPF